METGRTEAREVALAECWSWGSACVMRGAGEGEGRAGKEGYFLFSELHIAGEASFKTRKDNLPCLVLGL